MPLCLDMISPKLCPDMCSTSHSEELTVRLTSFLVRLFTFLRDLGWVRILCGKACTVHMFPGTQLYWKEPPVPHIIENQGECAGVMDLSAIVFLIVY